MSTKQKNVPKLRFPEFTDSWKQSKLGEITERVQGNDGRMALPTLTVSAGNGWMAQEDRFNRNMAGSEQKRYTLLKQGELSYNHGNSKLAKYGVVFVLQTYKEALVPRVYHSFRMIHGNDAKFCEYVFETKRPDKELGKLISSGARMDGLLNINYEDFMGINIKIPSTKEQVLIRKHLENVDTLITLQQRKLDQIKEYKKGMLQKMFPKEGETVPEVRFPGFTGEWELRKLGDIVNVYDGTHQTPNYQDHGVMFVSVEDIQTLTSEKYISEEDFEKNYSVVPEPGDILMTRIGDIGTANIVRSASPLAYYVSLALLKNKQMNADYLKANISAPAFQNELWVRTLHTAYPKKINKDEIGECLIRITHSTEEQDKIGYFFSSLDTLITLHQRKLDAMKEYKKGLLQQMFV